MVLTNYKLRVFLCHAAVDKRIVYSLYQSLKSENWIDPWLYTEKLLPGQHWTSVIRQAIDSADVVITCISNKSINGEGFVQREMNYAWEKSLEKPKSTIFLIPLRLEDCELPYNIRDKQWGDFFGNKKADTYQALMKSLRTRFRQILDREETKQSNETNVLSHQNSADPENQQNQSEQLVDFIDVLQHRADLILEYIDEQERMSENTANNKDVNFDVLKKQFIRLHQDYIKSLQANNTQLTHELLRNIYHLLSLLYTIPNRNVNFPNYLNRDFR